MNSNTALPGEELGFYERAYSSYSAQVIAEVRRETYGEDVGQSSWSTAEELRRFAGWMGLGPASHVLDVCSGSGGPALLLCRETGCHVTGGDTNPHGIENAQRLAVEMGLRERARFLVCDVRQGLPLAPGSVDALWCIDSVIHLPDRLALLREWHRVLKPGGRFVYTDPTLVTGMVSKEEVLVRGTLGYFMYTPPGINERLIEQAGLRLEEQRDCTQSIVEVSQRWHDARASRREPLLEYEGVTGFERLQHFLATTYVLACERRLSREVFVGSKPV